MCSEIRLRDFSIGGTAKNSGCEKENSIVWKLFDYNAEKNKNICISSWWNLGSSELI